MNVARHLAMLGLGAIGIYWSIVFRFQNPHLTETELFLERWWLSIPLVALTVLWAYLKVRAETRSVPARDERK